MAGHQVRAPDWRERWLAIVARLQVCDDVAQVLALLNQVEASRKPLVIAFVNAHAMNLVVESPAFYQSLMSADLILRDGTGMALLMRALGRSPGLNLNGTDLIPRLLKRYTQRKVALMGTSDEALQAAVNELRARGHAQAITTLDGFQPEAAYIDLAQRTQPELVVLAMGMPKQEAVAALLRPALSGPAAIVCGGAIVDFLSGRVPRAPRAIRWIGIEWLYRLCLEPKRLFSRYVIGNPLFILRLLLASKSRRSP